MPRAEQFFVRAPLDDAAAVEHQNQVGPANGGQPMRNDERRAIEHQRRQRILHQQLRLAVERRGRLVEDEDRRVPQDGAGDGQALALTARQPLPALADLGARSRRACAMMNSCACAARAAASISAGVAAGRP